MHCPNIRVGPDKKKIQMQANPLEYLLRLNTMYHEIYKISCSQNTNSASVHEVRYGVCVRQSRRAMLGYRSSRGARVGGVEASEWRRACRSGGLVDARVSGKDA